MQPERERKIRSVIRQSQPDLTVVLENIFDPLNISAVLRSCDAVGVREVFVVYTKKYLDKRGLILGKRTSGGTFKWIDVYIFEDLEECFKRVRERYGRILATRLGEHSESLYALDLTQPTALLFGNEDEGISAEALAMADGNFLIPQAGFAESLNISVACAVSLFEARRQRAEKGFYDRHPKFSEAEQEQLFERWNGMLKEKSWHRQFATPVGKDSAPLLPVFVERNENAPKKAIRPNPLTKFEL
ncbi:MAG TPA: RNA methyltransferase [Saprospiraceae bacterium]|nr:RNA methyltransferase [Saprospiraceae bacterium]